MEPIEAAKIWAKTYSSKVNEEARSVLVNYGSEMDFSPPVNPTEIALLVLVERIRQLEWESEQSI